MSRSKRAVRTGGGALIAILAAWFSLDAAEPPPPCDYPQCVPVITATPTTTWGYRAQPMLKCIPHRNLFAWLFHKKEACPDCQKPIPCQALWKRKITTQCPSWKCELDPKKAELSAK